jgi:hypothetical protein
MVTIGATIQPLTIIFSIARILLIVEYYEI